MRAATRAQLLGCFLIAFGVKLAILAWASSPVPFADEWDGDAALVLKPFLEGHLQFWDLFCPHNEHFIPVTRLFVLAGFKISGYWDVVLQMIANAAIHSLAIVFIAYFLAKPVAAPFRPIVWLLGVVVLSIPFGWENLLLGFNTHFYLLILFSFAAFVLLAQSPAWSARWLTGTALAVAAFFNVASGALTLPVAIAVALLQCLRRERKGTGEYVGIAVHIALTLAMLRAVPQLDDTAFKAHNVMEFLGAAATLLSWPTHPPFGLITYAPVVILLIAMFRTPSPLTDGRWFIIAGAGWVAAQVCAIAIGRANGFLLSSRYFDALQIGMMVNLASAFVLLSMTMASRRRVTWAKGFAFGGWMLLLAIALVLSGAGVGKQVDARRQTAMIEAVNMRAYLTSGDFSYLKDKSEDDIGYPVPERLRDWLDDPTIRRILPPILEPQQATGAAEGFKSFLFALRYWLIGLGLVAWLLPFALRRAALEAPSRLAESRD